MEKVETIQGSGPLILSFPHSGTYIPQSIWGQLNDNGKALKDTDWHVDRLYKGLVKDASQVHALFHRYVIDPNRDSNGQSLYPGHKTTELVPMTDFDGLPIWETALEHQDIEHRIKTYYHTYHSALRKEVKRIKAIHGFAILYDCHSIRSNIPHLFQGALPDFNIGTYSGQSCRPELAECVERVCMSAEGYSTVLNGRFKGGWTTRHYGQPNENVHAIQMELSQINYLSIEDKPWVYDEDKAANLRIYLGEILTQLNQFKL